MALIMIMRDTALAPQEAWRRITDWPQHARQVPFTTVEATRNGFVARTGVGRFAFDDPMDITEWDPPRVCRLEKRGRVVLGWARITVASQGAGSRVTWHEEIRVRGLPRLADRLTGWAARRLFGRVLDRLLRDPA